MASDFYVSPRGLKYAVMDSGDNSIVKLCETFNEARREADELNTLREMITS